MKCPYCEEEMEVGLVQSARAIFWGKEKHKLSFISNVSLGDVPIAALGLNGSSTPGFYCKKCSKIIVDV